MSTDTSSSDGESEKTVENVESMWGIIYRPVINVFFGNQNETTKETVYKLLETFISSDLKHILVPASPNCPSYDVHIKRYSAFVTWLFGVAFHLTGTSEDNKILENSIELQARMLIILFSENIEINTFIMSEYLNILEELFKFKRLSAEGEKLELCKFKTEISSINDMELKSFPVVIKYLDLTKKSILQIMIKTSIYKWNSHVPLWNIMIQVFLSSSPKTKLVALNVIYELLEFNHVDDIEIERVIKFVTQMVDLIPKWSQEGIITKDVLEGYSKIFPKLIKFTIPNEESINLSLTIFNLISQKILGDELKEEIYQQIYEYQKSNYLFNKLTDNQRAVYSETIPDFNKILLNDVLTDVKNNSSNEDVVKVREISKLWSNLRICFINSLPKKNFFYISGFLESTNLLCHWFIEHKIQAQLFEDDVNVITNFLLENLSDSDSATNSLVFQCLICLLSHLESDKKKILNVLYLPWSKNDSEAMNIDKNIINVENSIDFETKLKCLESICRYVPENISFSLLTECVSMPDIKFSIAGIPNCLLLASNKSVKVENILKLMFSTISCNSPELHEIVAKTLGGLICLSSKRATLVRESWNKLNLIVKCDVCDKPEQENDSRIYNLSSRCETIISSFFNALMTSKFEGVRLQMSNNFLRFSNHIKEFNTNQMAKLWLPYIKDNNSNVRENIGKIIGYLLQNRIAQLEQTHILSSDDVPIELEEFVDSVILILHDSIKEAIDNREISLLKDLIYTAQNFACVELHLTERRILSLFVYTLLHPNSEVVELKLARTAFEKVAEFYHLLPMKMYIRYRKHFLKMMIHMSVTNLINYNYSIVNSLYRISYIIGYTGPSELVAKEMHFFVSYLIPHIVQIPKVMTLLEEIAERHVTEKEDLLKTHFPYICVHLLLDVDHALGVKCLNFVLSITNSKIETLLHRYNFMAIFDQLFLRFYDRDDVIECLEMILEWSGVPTKFETKENITEYLQPFLHGVLATAEINLRQIIDEESQQCAIASLVTLIHFMGPQYITPLRYKLLSTLRMFLNFTRPGFRKLTFEAWDAFIRNTFIDDLGPLLPAIFSSVVPLLESYPKETNEMLEYLIVKNEGALSPYIPEIFFIEDINVSRSISTVVTTCITRRRTICIKEDLGLWIKRIGHEIDSVRLRALVHLKKFLFENRSELNELILTNANVHPLILELLDMLIAGCRDKDEAIQLAYGECLGELGAIEPSLLPKRIVSRDGIKFIADINEEFACAAILEFARGFQMQKNSHDADCFSLAIQEILKAYNISPDGSNKDLWEKMPFTVQEMIYPFLTSNYTIMTSDNHGDYPHPIYGTDMSVTYEKWAYHWVMSMFANLTDPQLKSIFIPSSPSLKRDVRIVEFFIPHIATFLIRNGTEKEWSKIASEMLAVITGNDKSTDNTLLNTRPLYDGTTESKSTRISDEAKQLRCSQVVFSILEHLRIWLRERRLEQNEQYKSIQKFCEMFDGFVLAEGSYKTCEYYRALMYLEQHMAISKKGLTDSKERDLLVKIYLQLEDPDGVSGIYASQIETLSLQQLVLAHEISGQFQDAATCYEKMVLMKDAEPKYLQGMIQCYSNLEKPFTAMSITKGVLEKKPELEPLLFDDECFWRLAHFGKLEDSEVVKNNYLENLKNSVKPDLRAVKKKIVTLLAAASYPGAYEHSYSYIMKLHIINEFEKATEKILENVNNVPSIFEEWEKRFQLVKASRGVEFVLRMRRATLDLAFLYQQETANVTNSVLKEEIGKIWIKSAKIARKAGLYPQAYMYILSAGEMCKPQELCTEKAQLYWHQGNQEYAFTTLKRCFDNYFPTIDHFKKTRITVNTEERKQCAKAKLLFAKYNHETQNVDKNTNVRNFKEAVEVWKCWEKSYVALAQYHEYFVDKMTEDEKDCEGRDHQVHSLTFYGRSLNYGSKCIHHSMPRILTIWLDYASRTNKRRQHKTATQGHMDGLKNMTRCIVSLLDVLPTFTWLTAFSQIASRICHPAPEVKKILKAIIVKLILAHPQHCLWMIASIDQSAFPTRQKQCHEILSHEKMNTTDMRKLIQDFRQLWKEVINLSDKPVHPNHSKTTVSSLSKGLPNLLKSSGFSAIMMPTSEFRKLHLPLKGESLQNHEPFLKNWVSIIGIEDAIVVMPSLQRPKRISLIGSDGNKYLFMCKPKDDLRNDFRLMEFNDIVNKYLQKDPKCRERRLYIRTYSVVPLNELCGLIEWVPNLVGLRPTLIRLYQEKGILVNTKELRTLLCDKKDSLEIKRKTFVEKLLPRHPPALDEWFRLTFPDPYGWYEARTAYIRTTAVMSMVGYILGLGDRHGENMLFDSKCGDCVHVDFNCLFNRGERLEVPERVPFRLTHNMTHAMGPLKHEGPFRRSCEVTMKVLREQTTTLMSVLEPFIYDPFVHENKAIKLQSKDKMHHRDRKEEKEEEEKTNEENVSRITNLHHRLKGEVRSMEKKEKIYLSVEGQTDALILQATNIDNLCQMYCGWGAFL